MARPLQPLIDKEAVCEIALSLIETEGIDAVTIRRIGTELGVNGASLYHHFKDKDEIIAGAAELALRDAHTSREGNEDWKTWCLRNAERSRAVLRRYPDLIPVLTRRNRFHIAFPDLEFYFEEFEKQGLAIGMMWPLMLSLQALTVGTVLHEQQSDETGAESLASVRQEAGSYDHIRRATEERWLTPDEEFRLACGAIVEMVQSISNVHKLNHFVEAEPG